MVLKYRRLHLYVPTTCFKGTCRKYITDAGFHLFLKRLFLNPQSPSKREDKLSLETAAFESQLSKKKKKKKVSIIFWLVSRTSVFHSNLITKLDPTPVEYVRGKNRADSVSLKLQDSIRKTRLQDYQS